MSTPQLQVGSGMRSLLKEGTQHLSGLEQNMLKNIEACTELGRVTRTSMGPNGMNKLVVNHLNRVFVTSDAATILSEMEVVHPAAKILVLAAKMQEDEFGDFTNFVVSFATELLLQAQGLLRVGVHPSDIILGFKKGSEAVLEMLPELVCHTVSDVRDAQQLAHAIKGAVNSKFSADSTDLLPRLIGQASSMSMHAKIAMGLDEASKKPQFNTDNVRVAKMMGGAFSGSSVLKGMVVQRPPMGDVRRIDGPAKVAVFGTSVEAAATETKGTVLIESAEELLSYNSGEEALMEERIRGIRDSGANVIVSGGSVSDMALHFIERYGMMCIKVTSKFELRRMCRTTGATPLVDLRPLQPEELGHCDVVEVREIAGEQCTVFEQRDEESQVATVVLRSSTSSQLDDLERAVDDGVNTVKTLCNDPRLLPGGGATEIALALRVAKLAEATPGLEQYAINRFADALEIIPRIISENAGHDPKAAVSELYAAHKAGKGTYGIDVNTGAPTDVVERGVFDTFAAKWHALRLASDAAITVLKVDHIIMGRLCFALIFGFFGDSVFGQLTAPYPPTPSVLVRSQARWGPQAAASGRQLLSSLPIRMKVHTLLTRAYQMLADGTSRPPAPPPPFPSK